jgi:hypothetical protein
MSPRMTGSGEASVQFVVKLLKWWSKRKTCRSWVNSDEGISPTEDNQSHSHHHVHLLAPAVSYLAFLLCRLHLLHASGGFLRCGPCALPALLLLRFLLLPFGLVRSTQI